MCVHVHARMHRHAGTPRMHVCVCMCMYVCVCVNVYDPELLKARALELNGSRSNQAMPHNTGMISNKSINYSTFVLLIYE